MKKVTVIILNKVIWPERTPLSHTMVENTLEEIEALLNRTSTKNEKFIRVKNINGSERLLNIDWITEVWEERIKEL